VSPSLLRERAQLVIDIWQTRNERQATHWSERLCRISRMTNWPLIDPPPVIQMRVFKLSDDGKEDEVTPLE
jgi:hypothetical protein